jgi:predicted  nucleic acid-binding Zn-ribbon protein
MPTLFAAQQEVATLGTRIQQNQAETEAAHKLSAAKGDEAEVYLRRAEGETGDQQVDDTTTAANDRRDAALADAKAATLSNDLERMQSNLSRATDQETELAASLKSVNDQIQAQQTRWTSIGEQIKAQQKVEQSLIGDASSSSTIGALAKDLAARLQDAAGLREKINNELNAVIEQLRVTIVQCQQLRNEWVTDVQQKQDDPDVTIWKQAEETLHPMNFGLQMAAALETKASVAAAKVRIDQLIYHLMSGDQIAASAAAAHFKNLDVTAVKGNTIVIPGLSDLLDSKKTGIEKPKAFDDLPQIGPDDLAQAKDEVNKDFQDATDAFDPTKFGAIDSGPAADQRRNVALMDGAEANRQWAQFATMMGDASDAQNHSQAASDMESQIDPQFALTASATTANAAAPGASPAPTPGQSPPAP